MFEIGDYVVNANNGICKITEVVELDLSGGKTLKPYYLLVPMEETTAKVFIPVDNANNRIRKVINKEEAIDVIDRIPDIEETCIANEKERESKYKAAIKSCELNELVGIIKNLYHRQQDRLAQGKKSTAVDERYFKLAESHLYSELAFAMGRQKQEMQQLICDRLESVKA